MSIGPYLDKPSLPDNQGWQLSGSSDKHQIYTLLWKKSMLSWSYFCAYNFMVKRKSLTFWTLNLFNIKTHTKVRSIEKDIICNDSWWNTDAKFCTLIYDSTFLIMKLNMRVCLKGLYIQMGPFTYYFNIIQQKYSKNMTQYIKYLFLAK